MATTSASYLGQNILENWEEIKHNLKDKWHGLNDRIMDRYVENTDQLVEYIRRMSGDTKEDVEAYLQDAVDVAVGAISKARKKARKFTSQVADRLQNNYKAAADTVVQGYADAEEFVRHRPAASLSIAFGLGFLISGLLAFLLQRRDT